MLIQEKIRQAAGLLKEFDVDCWLTFVRESAINGDPVLPFLVGADVTWHSAFIITRDGEARAIVGQYDKKAIEDLRAYTHVEGYVEGIRNPLQSILRPLDPRRIAVNFSKDSEICDGLTHGMYLTLVDILQEIGLAERLVSAERVISALRERKTEHEIGAIRRAIGSTLEIFDAVRPFIQPGRTEKEIAEAMTAEMRRKGLEPAWDASVCPSVFTGPETAGAHYNPTEREVKPGHVLNMDFGVKVDEYCSDLQRTFYVREPGESTVPEEVQKGFDTIVESIEQARRAMKPGVQGVEIDAVARRVLKENGYEEFPHALGHQVGRFAHDGTALLGPAWEKYAGKPFRRLETGMVFTLEPRLMVKGKGIATVEEMVVVTGQGADFLSEPQKNLIVI